MTTAHHPFRAREVILLVLVLKSKILQLVSQSKELLVGSTRLKDKVAKTSGKIEVELYRNATINMKRRH